MVTWSDGWGYNFALARYNGDGSLDPTFGNGGKLTTHFGYLDPYGRSGGEGATAIAVDSQHRIVVAGYSYQAGGTGWDFTVGRYNSDGSLDTTFDGDGKALTNFGSFDDYAMDVAIDADDNIVVAGYSGQGGSTGADFALARYNATDGSLDTTLGSGTGKVITDIGSRGPDDGARDVVAVEPDGKILVAGSSLRGSYWWDVDFALARYNADGSLDTTFGQDLDGDGVRDGRVMTDFGGYDVARAIGLQPDGKIVVAGGRDAVLLARYNADGTLDTTFDDDGKVSGNFPFIECSDVAIDAEGNILVGAGLAR